MTTAVNAISDDAVNYAGNEAHNSADRLVDVAAHPMSRWPELSAVWQQLAEVSPYGSACLSRVWTEQWLETYGAKLSPRILIFSAGSTAVGICLLTSTDVRVGPFGLRCLFLNATGEDDSDSVITEYNALLCLEGWERPVAEALARHVGTLRWDRLVLAGMAPNTESLSALRSSLSKYREWRHSKPSPFVNLGALQASEQPYDAILSSKLRKQFRQNLRKYGTVRLSRPKSVEEALAFLDMMVDLQRRTWHSRGQTASFDSDVFLSFHRCLIQREFGTGGVELFKVESSLGIVGIAYNLIHRSTMHAYQWGFNYLQDKQLKPGLIVHWHIVNDAIGRNFVEYDFMAGDSSFKRSMSNDCRDLEWFTYERSTPRTTLLNCARAFRRIYQRSDPRLSDSK